MYTHKRTAEQTVDLPKQHRDIKSKLKKTFTWGLYHLFNWFLEAMVQNTVAATRVTHKRNQITLEMMDKSKKKQFGNEISNTEKLTPLR